MGKEVVLSCTKMVHIKTGGETVLMLKTENSRPCGHRACSVLSLPKENRVNEKATPGPNSGMQNDMQIGYKEQECVVQGS